MIRQFGIAAAIVLCGCGISTEVHRAQLLRGQELDTTVQELQARLTWEEQERQRLQTSLGSAREGLSALQADRDRILARSTDLASRLDACGEREAGAKADLDLCRRSRTGCEEDRDRCRTEAARLQTSENEERKRRAEALESCRGRVADLEAQASMLVAERKREEREKSEKIDEITRSYRSLLEGVRQESATCQMKVSELELHNGKLESLVEEVLGSCRQRLAEAETTGMALASALGQDGAVERQGDRVLVSFPEGSVYLQGSADLSPAGRALLDRLVEPLQAAVGAEIRVSNAGGGSVSGHAARKFSTALDFSLGRAISAARYLGSREGMVADRVAASGSATSSRSQQGGGGAEVVVEVRIPGSAPCASLLSAQETPGGVGEPPSQDP